MKPFLYESALDVPQALRLHAARPHSRFLGGGTNLVDLMRENVEQPDALVDVSRLPTNRIDIGTDGTLSIGAAATNSAVANHASVRERFPVLAQAIVNGASGQIRNMATVGGNLMQRTRCPYFYDLASKCNKRTPASGCDAREGFNRMHAILGASDHCVAVHPSDMCVALAALNASVFVESSTGSRRIHFEDFHRLPGTTPQIETELRDDELIVAVECPPLPDGAKTTYRKVRDRASYAFALVSIAAVVAMHNGVIVDARLAFGGVAHKPWRARRAEAVLIGATPSTEHFEAAARAEFAEAKTLEFNAFKPALATRILVSVLDQLTGRGPTS